MTTKRKNSASGLGWAFVFLAVLALGVGEAVAGDWNRQTKLLVGYLPVTGHAKLFVAKEEGFFAEEGLDVELIQYVNSADGIGALCAAKLDVGSFGSVAPLVYIAGGANLRIIGGMMGEDAYVVTLPDNAELIRTPADLRGRRVGTVRLASGDAVLRGALKQVGLSWRTDLNLIELSRPELVIQAVKNRQIDAGVIWGPHDLLAQEEGLRVVFSTADLFPGHPCCRLVVRVDALVRKHALWPRFIRAILKAERFTGDSANKERVVNAIGRYLPIDKGLIARSYYREGLEQSSDPNVRAVKQIWDIMRDCSYISSNVDPQSHIVVDIYRQALVELMQDEPDEPFWQEKMREFKERNVLADSGDE